MLALITWGMAVALAALVAAIVVLVRSGPPVDDELTAAQVEVAAAARTEALAFVTVDHRNMDPLINAVLAGATGDFKKQNADQREQLVRQAERTDAVSTGEIVALGVGDLDEDSATVLVAANSDVSNTMTGDQPQTRYYRLRLDLVREGDRWLTRSAWSRPTRQRPIVRLPVRPRSRPRSAPRRRTPPPRSSATPTRR